MGGCGSGRHHGVRKRRVESCLALDVNVLRRLDALAPGASGTLMWERDGDARVSVRFRAEKATSFCLMTMETGERRAQSSGLVVSSIATHLAEHGCAFCVPARSAADVSRCSIS